MRRAVVLLAFTVAACCECAQPSAIRAAARDWPEADALFLDNDRFLGADSAYSAPLPGDDRVLWLFGDTFVATSPNLDRHESVMVRTALAVQTGRDPSTASIEYFFGGTNDAPASFFADDDAERWRWPGTPALVDGKLLVFLWNMRPGGGLGFELDHTSALLVDNPEDSPADWRFTDVDVPTNSFGVALGTGGALVDDDDGFLWLLATKEPGLHGMVVARVPVRDAARGDLSQLEWKTPNAGFASLANAPDEVFAFGQTELSLTKLPRELGYGAVQVDGFGAVPIALRTVDALGDRFSPPEVIYRPPEMERDGVFLYSAKAHPELVGDDLVISYCSNHRDFAALVDDQSLYFPRFVRVALSR